MKITAQDLLKFGIIDMIVAEPPGGAHRDPDAAMDAVGAAVASELSALSGLSREAIRDLRATKFLAMGRKVEEKR